MALSLLNYTSLPQLWRGERSSQEFLPLPFLLTWDSHKINFALTTWPVDMWVSEKQWSPSWEDLLDFYWLDEQRENICQAIWKYFSGLQLRYSDCNKIRLTAVIALYNLQNYNTRNVANHSQHILYFLESPTYQTTHYVQPLSTFFLCSAQNPSSSSLKQHRFQGFIFYYPIFQF